MKMIKPYKGKQIAIYQAKNGAIELREDIGKETLWASQAQIAQIFLVDRTVVTKHIRKIFQDKEISQKSNVQKMHIANSDKLVNYYSLDVILAIGYRTNSARAIAFRQWATKTLRKHIVEGFTINKEQLSKNYDLFLKTVEDIKLLLPDTTDVQVKDVLELIKVYANTWLSLSAYDSSELPTVGSTKKKIDITAHELLEASISLRDELINQKLASELFGQEKSEGSIEGIVKSIFQSYGGTELYPTLEDKAANLLYLIIKNHPFVDGNKRTGAFAFIWFLQKARIFDIKLVSPEALTALTIMIAESKPADKEKMIGIVLMLLQKYD